MRDEAALRAAVAVFERPPPRFGADELAAMAGRDPGHDARLDPGYRAAVVPFYASSALGERAAEAYAHRAAEDAPAPLRPGFAVQAEDERRHAVLDEARLAQLGIDAPPQEITPGVAAEMEESLTVSDPLRRMFLTNFIGETALAGATFPFVIALAEANGDRLSAELNRTRLADERRHVAFAVMTFRILVVQERSNRAVLQAWQDEHFAQTQNAFIEEVAAPLERAPNRPADDWLEDALRAYRVRAAALGLSAP